MKLNGFYKGFESYMIIIMVSENERVTMSTVRDIEQVISEFMRVLRFNRFWDIEQVITNLYADYISFQTKTKVGCDFELMHGTKGKWSVTNLFDVEIYEKC